jgi:hypothetical protein
MKVYVHRRPIDRVAAWLRDGGFFVEAELLHLPDETMRGGFLVAHRDLPARDGGQG